MCFSRLYSCQFPGGSYRPTRDQAKASFLISFSWVMKKGSWTPSLLGASGLTWTESQGLASWHSGPAWVALPWSWWCRRTVTAIVGLQQFEFKSIEHWVPASRIDYYDDCNVLQGWSGVSSRIPGSSCKSQLATDSCYCHSATALPLGCQFNCSHLSVSQEIIIFKTPISVISRHLFLLFQGSRALVFELRFLRLRSSNFSREMGYSLTEIIKIILVGLHCQSITNLKQDLLTICSPNFAVRKQSPFYCRTCWSLVPWIWPDHSMYGSQNHIVLALSVAGSSVYWV